MCVIIFYLNILVPSLIINKLLRYFSLHDDLKLYLFSRRIDVINYPGFEV